MTTTSNTASPTITPQAVSDQAATIEDRSVLIDVLANDLGGAARQLYSLDQESPLAESTSGSSKFGALIRIEGGKVFYDPSNASSLQALAQGQTVTDTFTYSLQLANGKITTTTVYVTLTGTNDAPVVTNAATELEGSVTEAGNADDGTVVAGVAQASGQLRATDVDNGATQTWSLQGTPSTTYGTMAIDAASGKWTYTLDNTLAATQSLAAGEQVVETFVARVTDDFGAFVDQTIQVTITGTNDTPVAASDDVAGAVTEAITPAGALTDSGSIAFSDVDLTDVHAVGAVTASDGALGTLVASVASDTTGSGTGGAIAWNYSVDAAAVEYLAAGETKVESFTFALHDGHGGTVQRTVQVTITGTNDAPVVASDDVTAAVTEAMTPAGALTDSGSIAFSDVDLTDVHAVGAVTASDGALGTLVASIAHDSTGSGTGGSIAWNYSVDAAAVEYLAAGETKVESFTFALEDGHGGTVQQTVSVTVTGTNDAPVMTSGAQAAAFTELADGAPGENDAGYRHFGVLTFVDTDVTDVHSATVSPQGSGYLGQLVLGAVDQAQDSVGWNFSVADGALDSLQAGQTVTQQYDVAIDDGHGGSATQVVTITLTGSNDGPVITSSAQSASVAEVGDGAAGENASTHVRTGAVTFRDMDTHDTHAASVVAQGSGYVGTFSLDAVDQAGDSIGWNFDVDDSALDSLQAGQTLTQKYDISVDDGHGGTAAQTVTVTLVGTNDAPVITAGDFSAAVTAGTATGSGNASVAVVYSGSTAAPSALVAQINDHTYFNSNAVLVRYDQVDSAAELSHYDVVIDAQSYYESGSEQYYAALKDWVQAGQGGVITTDWFAFKMSGNTLTSTMRANADFVTPITTTAYGWGYSDATVYSVDSSHPITAGITSLAAASGAYQWSGSLAPDGDAVSLATFNGISNGFGGLWNGVVYKDVAGMGREVYLGGFYSDQSYAEPGTRSGVADRLMEQAVHWVARPNPPLTGSGSISFSDSDVDDVHAVGAVTASEGTLGTLTASLVQDTTGSGTGGSIAWNYSVDPGAVKDLAAGQTKVENFTVVLNDDHGGSVQRTISVTLTGSNDAPVITSGVQSASVAELADRAAGENTTQHVRTGALTFTDADLADLHSATVSPQGSGYLGQLTLASVNQAGDSVGWTFSVADSALDALQAGQVLTQNYEVAINDGHGGTATQVVTVTLAGSNDAPLALASSTQVLDFQGLTGGTPNGIFTEYGVLNVGGYLVDGSELALDPGNSALATYNYNTPTSSTTMFSANGSLITRTDGALFDAVSVDLDHLRSNFDTGTGPALFEGVRADGSLVEASFAIDQVHGMQTFSFGAEFQNLKELRILTGLVAQYDNFVLGTKGGATSSPAPATANVTEIADNAPGENTATHSQSGTFAFTDPDLLDLHSATASATGSGYIGTFSLGSVDQAADRVQWNFSVADNLLEGLRGGQVLVQNYQVSVSDGHGGSVAQEVSVRMTGSNDAATISGVSTGALREDTTLTTGGTLAVADADSGESAFGEVGPLTGEYGKFTFNTDNGVWGYTLNNAAANVQALAEGQLVHDSLLVKSLDGTASRAITVDITGKADGPAGSLHLVTFDEPGHPVGQLPQGYAGFNWVGTGSSYQSNGPLVTLYASDYEQNGGDFDAYNGYGPKYFDITRTDGSDFAITSLSIGDGAFLGSGYESSGAHEVDFVGYNNGAEIFRQHQVLDPGMQHVDLQPSAIDDFRIVITNGGYNAGTGWYSVDDLALWY